MNRVTRAGQRLRGYAASPSGRAYAAAVLTFGALLVVWSYAVRWYQQELLREERSTALAEASLRGNSLSLAINRRLARLQGLYAFVQIESSAADFEPDFSLFAEGLYAGDQGIRNIGVAPGAVIRYVYPLSGNERLLGTDMLHDPRPQVLADTQRAADSRVIVATGPIELAGGGLGLFARQAVYQQDTLWGFVFISLDVPVLLADAQLSGDTGEFAFALRDSERPVFFGPGDIAQRNPVRVSVQLSEEKWELDSIPAAGWGATTKQPLLIFKEGGLIIIALLAGLAYLSVNRQLRLTEAVQRRTREISRINEQLQEDIAERERAEAALAEREEQYRSVFESTSDAFLIFDLDGRLVDFNPPAGRLYGYSLGELGTLRPADLFDAGSMPVFAQFLDSVKAGRQFQSRAINLRRDGTQFNVEMDGSRFVYRGRPHALAVVRDITEEVQAYQLLEERVQKRTHEFATLLEASSSIASTLELRPLLDLILDQLAKVVDCTGSTILILENGKPRDVAQRGDELGDGAALLSLAQALAAQLETATARNEPLVAGDLCATGPAAEALRRALPPGADATPIRACMAVPFIDQEPLSGWLFLYHRRPGAFTAHQSRLVQTIANQAATAIENAHLFAQTRRLAALEERQRLARELHDSVSQVLYSIGLAGHTALAWLERDPAQAAEPMSYVLSLANAGLAEMRALIFELRPDSLEKDGLVAALTRQAAALHARHDLQIQTELCEEPALPTEVKEALYRIAQEALANVAKHAQAGGVVIRLSRTDGTAVLEVQDDGIGFDPHGEFPGQMGLHSMRERAAALGGRLEIESRPGHGALVRASFPF